MPIFYILWYIMVDMRIGRCYDENAVRRRHAPQGGPGETASALSRKAAHHVKEIANRAIVPAERPCFRRVFGQLNIEAVAGTMGGGALAGAMENQASSDLIGPIR